MQLIIRHFPRRRKTPKVKALNRGGGMKYRLLLAATAAVSMLASCAGFEIYRDPALKGEKTGVPFYTQKPYVLVSRTGAKDKPVDIQLIYITDHTEPYYVKARSGLGSNNLTLGLSNGMLTSFGQQTDPKLTELIGAIAGVPNSFATASKTRAEAAKLVTETGLLELQSSNLVSIAAKVDVAADDLQSLQNSKGYSDAFILPSQQAAIESVKRNLKILAGKMRAPQAERNRPDLIKQLEAESKNLAAVSAPVPFPASEPAYSKWTALRAVQGALAEIIAEAKPKDAPAPTLTLYEVVIDASGTRLKEVPFEDVTP